MVSGYWPRRFPGLGVYVSSSSVYVFQYKAVHSQFFGSADAIFHAQSASLLLFFSSFTHSHQVIRNSPLSYKLCELPDF